MAPSHYSTISAKQLGMLGEQVAARYLETEGYTIRQRNFRCRFGEIDLIADHEEFLVFVEVKSRFSGKRAISPLISMTAKKCRRLRVLGSVYLSRQDGPRKQPRFDVIGILFQDKSNYTIEHIKNAF